MTRNVFPKVKAVNHSYLLIIDFDLEIVKATEYCYRPLHDKELCLFGKSGSLYFVRYHKQ